MPGLSDRKMSELRGKELRAILDPAGQEDTRRSWRSLGSGSRSTTSWRRAPRRRASAVAPQRAERQALRIPWRR